MAELKNLLSAPLTGNLTTQIVRDLGAAIVKGDYSKELPFPVEAELCKQYGVSRSILREAMKMLAARGLVEARPRRGTEVQSEDKWNLLDPDVLQWMLQRKFSVRLLREFTEVRLAIEPAAASLAAQSATEEQQRNIENALHNMQLAEENGGDPLEPDIAFHLAVLDASNNRFFIQLKSLVETALHFSIRLTNRMKGVRVASIEDHKKISDAIIQGDSVRAAGTVEELLIEALGFIQRAAEEDKIN